MSILSASRPSTKPIRRREPRPLTVAMTIVIDGRSYDVAPVAPAPGAVCSFRFTKLAAAEKVYDVDEHATGAECSCRRRTDRPLLVRVYSEIAPTVLT